MAPRKGLDKLLRFDGECFNAAKTKQTSTLTLKSFEKDRQTSHLQLRAKLNMHRVEIHK